MNPSYRFNQLLTYLPIAALLMAAAEVGGRPPPGQRPGPPQEYRPGPPVPPDNRMPPQQNQPPQADYRHPPPDNRFPPPDNRGPPNENRQPPQDNRFPPQDPRLPPQDPRLPPQDPRLPPQDPRLSPQEQRWPPENRPPPPDNRPPPHDNRMHPSDPRQLQPPIHPPHMANPYELNPMPHNPGQYPNQQPPVGVPGLIQLPHDTLVNSNSNLQIESGHQEASFNAHETSQDASLGSESEDVNNDEVDDPESATLSPEEEELVNKIAVETAEQIALGIGELVDTDTVIAMELEKPHVNDSPVLRQLHVPTSGSSRPVFSPFLVVILSIVNYCMV